MKQKACLFQMNDGATRLKIIAMNAEDAIKRKGELVKKPEDWSLIKVEEVGGGIMGIFEG